MAERIIRFRGIRVDNDEWVYGYYYYDACSDAHIIYQNTFMSNENHSVESETIGQYTGLKDKNGKDIYEGDIVKIKSPKYNKKTNRFNYKKVERIVVYDDTMGMYCLTKSLKENDIRTSDIFDTETEKWYCEVIGNIHEKEVK